MKLFNISSKVLETLKAKSFKFLMIKKNLFNTFLQIIPFNISSKILETLKPKSFKFLMIKKKSRLLQKTGQEGRERW